MMVRRVLLSLLLSLLPATVLGQGVNAVHPVKPNGSALFPSAFASADNIAAQTATAMHGLTYVWDGANWDRWTGAVTQSGTWNLNNISGTISLPTGAATLSEQQTQTTALQLIDNLPLAQGASTAGQNGVLAQGAATTGAPTYTTGTTNPLSLTTAGSLRVDPGTVTVTATNLDVQIGGSDSLTIGTFPDNEPFNVAQINGVAPSMGNGASGTGVQRVTIANDSTGQIKITDGTDTALVTAGGELSVNCGNCSGSGASHTDNAAFTGGTDDVAPMGALYDTTPPAITDGNLGAPRMDSNRLLYSRPSDGTNTMPMMDAVARKGFVQLTDGTDAANVSASGKLEVTCDNCGGSSFADNSAFTFGTTNIMPMGFVYDDTAPNAVTENNAATPRMSSNRVPYAILRDAAGNERGANVTASNQLLTSADTELSASAAISADDQAAPTTSNIYSFNMCYDGTNWDRCRGTIVDTDDNSLASGQATSLILNLDHVFNGTNWTRTLSAANALNSTGSGLVAAQIIGQFDDVSPTAITENQFGNLRMSANRNLFGTIRDAAGNERGANVNASNQLAVETFQATASNLNATVVGTLAEDGAAAATNRVGTLPAIAESGFNASTAGRNTALRTYAATGALMAAVMPDSSLESYSGSAVVAPAASATDIAILPGNATNTVLVTEVRISCTQTTAGQVQVHLIKRSTANTGGTSSGMTEVPDDANYSAADSAGLFYTANPTTGSTVGDVDIVKLGCMATGTATPNDIYIGNFRQKPIVLRGTAQGLAVNLNGVTVSGGSFAITYRWIEATGL